MHRIRLILLGPPGAGKGTQAEKLCHDLGMLHLATGDLLRAAVANKTPVGMAAKSFMEKGELVPDQLVVDLLIAAVDADHGRSKAGYVFDGFPRTQGQAGTLNAVLQARGEQVDRVVLIDLPDDEIGDRVTLRRSCPDPKCGDVYNLKSRPPKTASICDKCGSKLIV